MGCSGTGGGSRSLGAWKQGSPCVGDPRRVRSYPEPLTDALTQAGLRDLCGVPGSTTLGVRGRHSPAPGPREAPNPKTPPSPAPEGMDSSPSPRPCPATCHPHLCSQAPRSPMLAGPWMGGRSWRAAFPGQGGRKGPGSPLSGPGSSRALCGGRLAAAWTPARRPPRSRSHSPPPACHRGARTPGRPGAGGPAPPRRPPPPSTQEPGGRLAGSGRARPPQRPLGPAVLAGGLGAPFGSAPSPHAPAGPSPAAPGPSGS